MKDKIIAILVIIILTSIFVLYGSLGILVAMFIFAKSILLGISFISIFTFLGAIILLEEIDKFW